jgi:VanZ family protein
MEAHTSNTSNKRSNKPPGDSAQPPTHDDAANGLRAVLWLVAAALCFLVIVALTLTPLGGRPRPDNFVPFVRHVAGIAAWLRGEQSAWALRDLIVNGLLFVPFGLSLALGLRALLGPRQFILPTLALGWAASALIELAQLGIPSRVTDTTDLILNGLGVTLSAWLVARRQRAMA